MVTGILTILFGVLSFVFLTAPATWSYVGDGKDLANIANKLTNGYNIISFGKGQDIYATIASIFLILAIVFGILTLVLTLVNLMGKAADNSKFRVGCKIVSILFFLSLVVAAVMIGVYAQSSLPENTQFGTLTIGYGIIGALISSLLVVILSPRKRRHK